MNSRSARKNLFELLWIAIIVTWACLSTQVLFGAHQASTGTQSPPAQAPAAAAAPHPVEGETFATPQQAADALIAAAGKFDEAALAKIFGPNGKKVIFTGEAAQDRQRALGFAVEAKEKTTVSVDPKTGTRAFIIVGDENWPFPVPIIKINGKWSFDAKAGEQELLYRRIGSNELDAIQICHGFVESQDDYALRSRQLYSVNQYAQRIVSTPGKQDGLTWQAADGNWEGPIGEPIAKAIAQGYTPGEMPYHGYFYKVLKGTRPRRTSRTTRLRNRRRHDRRLRSRRLARPIPRHRSKDLHGQLRRRCLRKGSRAQTPSSNSKRWSASIPTYPGIPLTSSEGELRRAFPLFGN